MLLSPLNASLNVSLTHDDARAGAPLPPPLRLLFGNSQMKNMATSHSTWAHDPVLSSSTQVEFGVAESSSSSGLQDEKACRGLESA